MNGLTYVRMTSAEDKDVPRLRENYQLPEIARFLSISGSYFDYVSGTPDVYFYKAYKENELVGAVHIELQQHVMSISVLVFPEFQRQGLAAQMVRDLQRGAFGLDYDCIEAAIDEQNAASLRLFENAGFVFVSQEDELKNYLYCR